MIPPKHIASGEDEVVAICSLSESGEIKVLSGKRHLTLKANDITTYSGDRAKRGTSLPRGFQKVDGIESSNKNET